MTEGHKMEPSEMAREVTVGDGAGFDTRSHLENAAKQAQDRNLQDLFIVDADAHHYETEAWQDVVKYIEDPVLRHLAQSRRYAEQPNALLNISTGNQQNAGRLPRYPMRADEKGDPGEPRDVTLIRREMESIGIDCQVVFPTPMLELGLHPDIEIEAQLSWAYTRWITEEILPHEPRIKTMVYLPFHDPKACVQVIEKFSDNPGVVGFMVTSARFGKPVHHNDYMPVYRALEERDMPLGFHAIFNQGDRSFEGMNRFLSVHALGFVVPNMVHMTNLLINGIPERFPNLKIIWIESGLAWVPFLAQRLDNEYLMRSAEAPLLTKLPSEYIKDFFYTSQPIESTNLKALQVTMEMINAESQLMFSSDYPHWDFNLPSTIYDLPFLDLHAKRQILGENARKLFHLHGAKSVPARSAG
jgi:uncharacterized protein